MNIDPILQEVHKIRREISDRFGGDLWSYSKSLKRTYPGFRVVRLKPLEAGFGFVKK